jgi:hypothetical protein
MRKFKYSLLVALGFLIFATTQYAVSSQGKQIGGKPQAEWGSRPGPAPTGVEGVEPGGGSCGFTTLRFNELPTQPVNGLTFRGVQFGFTIGGNPSSDAFYNAVGPGQGTFVQDPSLEGNAAGQLVLDFPVPTPTLSFGIARSTTLPLTPGALVLLFGPGGSFIGGLFVDLVPSPLFAEGQFTYNGPPPVSRAIIIFPSPEAATRFAIDNLTYRAFDIVLQDDADPNEIFQFNSITGDYQFFNCETGTTLDGRGGIVRFGCTIAIGDGGGNKGGPLQVSALVNTCTNQGTATVRILATGQTFDISDNDITDNTCCAENGEGK